METLIDDSSQTTSTISPPPPTAPGAQEAKDMTLTDTQPDRYADQSAADIKDHRGEELDPDTGYKKHADMDMNKNQLAFSIAKIMESEPEPDQRRGDVCSTEFMRGSPPKHRRIASPPVAVREKELTTREEIQRLESAARHMAQPLLPIPAPTP